MSILDQVFKTITCDNCGKTVTYPHPLDKPAMDQMVLDNPWLKTNRLVQTADQRIFSYCSDLCNIAGIETGVLNIKEAPKVEIPQGGAVAQIAAAAAAAKQREDANKAIKDGKPVTLHTS